MRTSHIRGIMSRSRALPIGSRVHGPVAASMPVSQQDTQPQAPPPPTHLQPTVSGAYSYQTQPQYQPHSTQQYVAQTPQFSSHPQYTHQQQQPIQTQSRQHQDIQVRTVPVGNNGGQHAQHAQHHDPTQPTMNTKPRKLKPSKEAADIILDNTSTKVDVHSKIRLFPHQLALTAKMIEMESTPRKGPFIGVLKDPPGSGKSYPLLALILHEKRQFGRTQNLLVIPHNIHKQWLKYIADFSDELQAISLMYYGDVTSLFYDARVLFAYDIIITTSTFYDVVDQTVKSIGAYFNRVILDEIDSISFFTLSQMCAPTVWLVSASAELTKTGAYAEAARHNGIVCDPLFIKRSINLEPPLTEHHTCYNQYVRILQHGVLSRDEMKYVYAVDFTLFKFNYLRNEDAITNPKQLLSAKFRDDCFALHSTLDSIKLLEEGSKYRPDLPQFLAQKIDKKDALEASIERILMLTGRSLCAICCEHFAKKGENGEDRKRGKTRCCRALFCVPCLEKWIAKEPRCPKCARKLMSVDTAVDIDTEEVDPEVTAEDGSLKDKMDVFYEILQKETQREGFRILIFSELTGTFLRVQNILQRETLTYAEIEGNQYTMDRAMTDYKTGKRPILLVDSQAYASGMNSGNDDCCDHNAQDGKRSTNDWESVEIRKDG